MHKADNCYSIITRLLFLSIALAMETSAADEIGREGSSYERLEDGEEHAVSTSELLRRGKAVFDAQWTPVDGGGRPLTTGTGEPERNPKSKESRSPKEDSTSYNRCQ